jgi:hypothetical protein
MSFPAAEGTPQPVSLVGINPSTNAITGWVNSDAQGGVLIAGEGTAGTPVGGVVTVQGIASGTPVVDNITQLGGNAINTGAGATGTGTARVAANTYDGSGNPIASKNSQLETTDTINTASQYRTISLAATTATQALGAATILVNRKVITVIAPSAILYWGTSSSVTNTNYAGFILPNYQGIFSFTDNVPLWIYATTATSVGVFEGS